MTRWFTYSLICVTSRVGRWKTDKLPTFVKMQHFHGVTGIYLPVTSAWQVDCVWNVMAHAQKTDFVFRRKRRVHLNQRGRQFSRLLAADVWASAVVMLDTPCSEVVWRIMATYSIRKFSLHFPSSASPCAITFQLDSVPVVGITSCQYVCE
jgi:hypothetical protein